MPSDKLKELILYIAEKCKDDPYFGATKLNKILFLADFNNYGFHKEPITGAKYVHRDFGPVPFEMPKAIDQLQKEGSAEMQEVTFFDYPQKRIVPCREPDASIFSQDELELVDTIIEKTKYSSGSELSDWSHTLLPYCVTKEGEEIPYYSVFVLHEQKPSPDDINWAKREVERIRNESSDAV